MRKVAFMIDGWFMRQRIYSFKTFYYNGDEIRKYCLRHLKDVSPVIQQKAVNI